MVRLPCALLLPLALASLLSPAAAQGAGVPAKAAKLQRPPSTHVPGNVLMIVMDEVGPDMINAYGIGTDMPPTPNLDALAQGGVIFRHMYSNPAGSVTMATLETGRLGELTGIGFTIYSSAGDFPLQLSETTLPEMLDIGTGGLYSHAMIGKWFLGKLPSVGGLLAPNVMGYGHYEGVMEQLYIGGWDYFLYPWVTDGVQELSTVYATTHTVDAALAWIAQQQGPWFCHVAFNSAHTPYHVPPEDLFTQTLPTVIDPHGSPRPWFKAMVEAMDTEIGRLFATIDPAVLARTTVIVLSDNGTPQDCVAPPFPSDHGKLTVYEGGINIPLIVKGPVVQSPGREVDALVQTTDLFSTIAELAGVNLDAALPGLLHQSVSIVPYLKDPQAPHLRDKVFLEVFQPNGLGLTTFNAQNYASRGARYKLIEKQVVSGEPFSEEFYDLWTDPYEHTNLLIGGLHSQETIDAYNELHANIDGYLKL